MASHETNIQILPANEQECIQLISISEHNNNKWWW